MMGRFESALTAFEQATAIAPNYTPAWQNVAAALNKLGRNEEAAAAQERGAKAQSSLISQFPHH